MKAARLGLIGLLLALGACAASIKSDVTRFHRLPQPQGETIAIVAADSRKEGSLEFQRNADILMGYLSRQGFRPATDAPPAYIAQLDYYQQPVGDFDDGSRSNVSIGIAGGSGGYHSSHVGVGFGTSFDVGEPRGGGASRTLTLTIDRTESGERVFEGRVKSMGPARNFEGALPYMIEALFTDFPGQSGTTITVETEVRQ